MKADAGYTHYFTWHEEPDEEALKACIGEMRRIIDARTNILAGPNGDGTIVMDSANVNLNGIGTNAHEPFVFPGATGYNFCKTAGKPYDEVVTACLLVARDHFPSPILSIESDGSWSDGDWNAGKNLYSSVLGRAPHDPMSSLSRVVGWRIGLMTYVPEAILLTGLIWFFWRNRKRV